MITDAHMHIGEFPLFNVSLDGDKLADYLLENGISTGLVFSPDNVSVRDVVQKVPNAFGLYWANPKMPGSLAEAREYLHDPRFRGMKLHPLLDGYHPDESFVWPFMELAIEFDVPVLFHCGTPIFTEPWSIEEVIARYEDAKVILGHMGHTNIVYIDGSIAVAERHPNVWLETSGMPMGSKIHEAVRRVGPNRVMYGSDGPFHHPKVEQLKVQLSGLTGSDLEDVMNNTAQRLFFS